MLPAPLRLTLALLGALLGWAPATPPQAAEEPIQVAVSVPPQAYFVERIGGDRVRVTVLIPPGASHETYSPSPRQMVEASRARVYVKVGHPQFLFERRYIDPFLHDHPQIAVVNMSQGMRFIAAEDHAGEGQGGDPHVWLAPYTVRIAAANIARELSRLDPGYAAAYEAHLKRFLADLDALDQEIRHELSGLKHRGFMIYHPAWGYFAEQYGLTQMAIESAGKEPSPPQLMALVREARRLGMHAVFVQKGFATKGAEVVAREIGGEVIELDPLAPDWLANMRHVAATLHRALDQ